MWVRFFLKNRVHVIFLAILAFDSITSHVKEVFPLLATESILTSSGVIRYDNSSPLARPLHVEGNHIKNDLGQIVHLRGWNKGRQAETLELHWGGWKQYLQSKVDLILDKMKSYGANVVRQFIVGYSWINNVDVPTETGTMKYRQALDDLLTRAAKRGMYVIISPYTLYPKDCPVHGPNSPDHKRDSVGYDPYTSDGHSGLIPNADAFKNFIAEIVNVLGSHENLIVELWNEPFAGLDWNTETKLNEWQSTWQKVIDAMRQKETDKGYVKHLIVVQYAAVLAYWGNIYDSWKNFNWIASHPLTDPADNLVYSLHDYRQGGSVGSDKPYDYDTLKQIYIEENVLYYSQRVPILIGEIGAHMSYDSDNGERLFLKNSLKIFNEWELSYIGWVWRDAGNSYDHLEYRTESVAGGTVNEYGQVLVDAIIEGEAVA